MSSGIGYDVEDAIFDTDIREEDVGGVHVIFDAGCIAKDVGVEMGIRDCEVDVDVEGGGLAMR